MNPSEPGNWRLVGLLPWLLNWLFLATLPIAVILLLGGRWVAGVLVFLLGTPLFWTLRNNAVRRAIRGYSSRSSAAPLQAQTKVLGMFEVDGSWQGTAEARTDGLIISGQRRWTEYDDPHNPEAGHRELQEDDSFPLRWGSFESAVVRPDHSLSLTPSVHLALLNVLLTDFDERGCDPWVALLREHRVPVTDERPPNRIG